MRWPSVPGGDDMSPPNTSAQLPATTSRPTMPARSPASRIIAMPPIDLTDINNPEFAPIRAQLARTYLKHKDDLGVPFADDADIVEHVDDITVLLFAASGKALRANDHLWMTRYRWFAEIINELVKDGPGKPLDS